MSGLKFLLTGILSAVAPLITMAEDQPTLRIGYSDWPGWTAWEIADKKGFFQKHGVNVKLEWFEYGPSIDAFSVGKIDAVGLSNGDAMVLNATGARNVIILINDYSNGNDKIVARPGINSVKELKGKKVGVEFGCLSHALLINALTKNGLKESDVELVNMPTHQAAQILETGEVDAVVAWQPHSGNALELVKGSKAIYTSADEPGIIYDVLTVSTESLMKHRDEWKKVIAAWYDVIDFLNDPATRPEAIKIMADRVGVSEKKYGDYIDGTRFLTAEEALARFRKTPGFDSIYGSSEIVDKFFFGNKIYKKSVDVNRHITPIFTKEYLTRQK